MRLSFGPNVHQVHAMREGGPPYGTDVRAYEVHLDKMLAVFAGYGSQEIEIRREPVRAQCPTHKSFPLVEPVCGHRWTSQSALLTVSNFFARVEMPSVRCAQVIFARG